MVINGQPRKTQIKPLAGDLDSDTILILDSKQPLDLLQCKKQNMAKIS
jgi:hypothetical protein